MVDLTSFWSRVNRELARFDLLQHPFYQAWSKGELTQHDLKFYAQQYYRHVSAFPTYLTALHSRLPEGRVRRAVLSNAWEEECADHSHSELWMRFVEGVGGSASEIARRRALPELNDLVETFQLLVQEAPVASAFGALFAYESQVPKIAAEKLCGLQKHYGADDRTCGYFALHRTADIHHSNVWREVINSLVEQDEMCADEVIAGVSEAARALWAALDGIERERGSRADAAGAALLN
jgi:pyrroloquinoline-quinone synthase